MRKPCMYFFSKLWLVVVQGRMNGAPSKTLNSLVKICWSRLLTITPHETPLRSISIFMIDWCNVSIYIYIYICVCVCVYIYIYIYIQIYIYICVCVCVCIYVCVCVYIYIYVCVCVYIYIYIYISWLKINSLFYLILIFISHKNHS